MKSWFPFTDYDFYAYLTGGFLLLFSLDLPEGVLKLVRARAARTLSVNPERIGSAEEVFQLAFPEARISADTAARLDHFRTLYGLSRNLAFTGAVCTALFLASFVTTCAPHTGWSALAAAVIAIGMYARFLKFYAGFAAEVFRTYAAGSTSSDGAKA